MKVFKFLCVRPVLLILVLGFSFGCGKDDTNDKTTDVAPDVAPVVTDDASNDVPNDNINDNHITDDAVIDVNGDVPDSEIEGDSNDDYPSENSTWSDLPYGVRTYVRKQTCSGGEVISSDLVVDFKDVELAPNLTTNNASSLPYIYCNDENTYCRSFKIEDGARPVNNERTHSNTLGWDVPVLFFDDLRNSDYSVTLIPKFKYKDPLDGNKVKEILFVKEM